MATFFTADLHVGHRQIIRHCSRPFQDIDEMHEALIRRWNDRVRSKSDDVYVVGDFGWSGKYSGLERIFAALNGRKHLVKGNHDGRQVLQLPWSSKPVDRKTLGVEGKTVYLDHYSLRAWPKRHFGAYHLYGHSHGNLPGIGRSIDVGVDVWDFRPITLNEAIEGMKRDNPDFEDESFVKTS
ncbi:metallophosphoesterase [Roseibium sp. RKSG952]|uniref:metallophosphoesterase n=1 Tax=Roseibium sp. RKSG952 TaxID=2529384 RepID=UPI0012BB531B|nr:metallophosphoesterase [Roseibium sp. RKSG952]MTH95526.1 metallophosphoesterase [Roseibium sp. RKSG952]